MKNNLSSYGEGNIKHPKKKFEKVVRVPPEGYESSNDFFEDVFMDKDMIWMGQNTNHLHGDIIADAMASCAKKLKNTVNIHLQKDFQNLSN